MWTRIIPEVRPASQASWDKYVCAQLVVDICLLSYVIWINGTRDRDVWASCGRGCPIFTASVRLLINTCNEQLSESEDFHLSD